MGPRGPIRLVHGVKEFIWRQPREIMWSEAAKVRVGNRYLTPCTNS